MACRVVRYHGNDYANREREYKACQKISIPQGKCVTKVLNHLPTVYGVTEEPHCSHGSQ